MVHLRWPVQRPAAGAASPAGPAAALRRRREAVARESPITAVSMSTWPALTPMSDGLLKKANPASTPSMARVNRTAVSMLTRTPMISVNAKPFGPAVAKRNSTRAVSIVRMLASRMVLNPRA